MIVLDVDHAGGVVAEHAEQVRDAHVDRRRLDQRLVERVDHDPPGGELFAEGAVGEDHARITNPHVSESRSATTVGRPCTLPRHFAEDSTDVAVAMVRVGRVRSPRRRPAPTGSTSTPVPFVISDDGERVRAHLARPNPIWKLAPVRRAAGRAGQRRLHLAQLVSVEGRARQGGADLELRGRPSPRSADRPRRRRVDGHDGARPDRPERGRAAGAMVGRRRPGRLHRSADAAGSSGSSSRSIRIEAKRKLSQNKSDADRAGAIAGLAEFAAATLGRRAAGDGPRRRRNGV